MSNKNTNTATNYKEIKDYLSSFAKGNETLEHYLCLALTDMLSHRHSCIRPQAQEDIGSADENLWSSLSNSLLSEKYIFDPSLEPGLDEKISATAAFLEATIDMQEQWNISSENTSIEPYMMKPEFLRIAISMIDPVNSNSGPSLDTRLINTLDSLDKSIRALNGQEDEAPGQESEKRADKHSTPTDMLYKYEDDWQVIRFNNYDVFYENHKGLSFCLGADTSREKLDAGIHSYCALINDANNVQCLFTLENDQKGTLQLKNFKVKGGAIADNHLIDRIIPFIHKEGIRVPSTEETGILEQSGQLYNVFNLPEEVTEISRKILLVNENRNFSLNHLERAEEIHIRHCPGFSSIGNLKKAYRLDVDGCKNLHSIDGLEMVHYLDLRKSGVTEIPKSLKAIARIWTDFGTYDTLLFSRRRFRKEFGNKNAGKALPGPS
jgi:hypothetical protein